MAKSKYDYNFVKNYFTENDCVLLSTEYHKTTELLEYRCSCGNIGKTSFIHFKRGRRCKQCGFKKIRKSKALEYNEVKNFFEQNNCVLLSTEYVNCKTPLDYICSCGNKSSIVFDSFKKGNRCKKCGVEKSAKTRTHTYEYVKKYFEDNNCILLSKEYIKNDIPLDYICSCGSISQVKFNNFLHGTRCYECGLKKISEFFKYTYDEVKNIFQENGCELLEGEYVNSQIPIKYKCSCGNISEIKLNHFISGHRCSNCKMSLGERKIQKFLNDNNIKFMPQYRFENCKNKRMLPFDVATLDDNNNVITLIEFHGQQHYEPVDYFGGIEYYNILIKNDNIKFNFCLKNKLPLLVIPYYSYHQVNDILSKYFSKVGDVE